MSEATMDIGLVIRRLDRERELYESLRELSQRQSHLTDGEYGIEDVLEILGRKQSVLAELEGVSASLASFKQNWGTLSRGLGAADQSAVQERVRAIRAVLEDLLAMEDRSREMLDGPRAGVLSQACAARRAYAGVEEAPAAAVVNQLG